jgi:hypothetical protein
MKMDQCFNCGKWHDRSYIDRRYCCKKCQVEDLGREQAEKSNSLYTWVINAVLLTMVGGAILTIIGKVVYTCIKKLTQ